MIEIRNKSECCGCSACVSVCPVQCIVMRRDREEGFDYPVANPDICISCGKCEAICPMSDPREPSGPVGAFAARSIDFVEGSSSGGVFPALAESVVNDGGVVFGAVVNPDMTVGHSEAEDMDEVEKMRGSKYVQSDLYAVHADVKAYLEAGRQVMFTGTPCQVAGLKAFLGRDYDCLTTADCACHGVPGPGLWERYVSALGVRYGSPVKNVRFRDKRSGWRNYRTVTCLEGREIVVHHQRDPYMLLFLQDMTLRPSCYQCRFRHGKSGSDITLADLWNVSAASPEFDDDKGVSAVFANTLKGFEALEKTGLDMRKVDPIAAVGRNSGFAESVPIPERREEFFRGYDSAKDIIKYMNGFVRHESVFMKVYKSVRSFVSRLIRRKNI